VGFSLQRNGDCTVVRAAGARSRRRNANSTVKAWDYGSVGRPAALPSGKSLNRKRGTPQYSTMSLAHPITTVAMPFSSKCRAARLTGFWHFPCLSIYFNILSCPYRGFVTEIVTESTNRPRQHHTAPRAIAKRSDVVTATSLAAESKVMPSLLRFIDRNITALIELRLVRFW